jgi:translation initiation factor 5B
VILVNGKLREGETIILPGTEGPIVTQIRGLLLPAPLREMRVKGNLEHMKEVTAAQGVKIIAKDLDKSLPGLPLYATSHDDEVPIYRVSTQLYCTPILHCNVCFVNTKS